MQAVAGTYSFRIDPLGHARNPGWEALARETVKKHPWCSACGGADSLEVHHVWPFHDWPELEMDPANHVVLCRTDHYWIGHGKDWAARNPYVRADAARMLKRVKDRRYGRDDHPILGGNMSQLPGYELKQMDVHSVPLPQPGYDPVQMGMTGPLPAVTVTTTSGPAFTSKCKRLIQRPRLDRPLTPITDAVLAARYGFPALTAPSAQWAAFLSLGGGTSMKDIQGYCQQYGLPVPPVRFIGVKGATNDYTGDQNSADGENALDAQRIIGFTRGKVGILIYGAPNSDDGFASAVEQCAADNLACVLSCSWGSVEQGKNARMDAAIAKLKALGVPFPAASGDAGSGDGGRGNNDDYPASCPDAIACGGTSNAGSTETAWSFGGGGPSHFYAKPPWQAAAPGSMRGVPDVAGNADPNSGFPTLINGTWGTFGGTSAVGPIWAAAVATIVSITGKRVFNLAEAVYANDLLTDIISGSNGGFQAAPGYDWCTGKGVPSKKFFDFMTAGATNPPPVLPPPVVPPPVTPPPAIPPPTQDLPTKAQADNLFIKLKNKHQNHPKLLRMITVTQSLSDASYQGGNLDWLDDVLTGV